MATKGVGDRGEDLAAGFLVQQGYRILERNYRYEHAEVDLVCFDPEENGGEIVFVEVKTRTTLSYGRPEEGVSPEQEKHIARAADAFLYERKLDNARCRFDVVSVMLHDYGEPRIEHLKDAFWAG